MSPCPVLINARWSQSNYRLIMLNN
ncbi:hypothetical protein DFAR_1860005 [Desulfarculales bacterium]